MATRAGNSCYSFIVQGRHWEELEAPWQKRQAITEACWVNAPIPSGRVLSSASKPLTKVPSANTISIWVGENKDEIGWVWPYTPVFSTLGSKRQEDCCKFKASLDRGQGPSQPQTYKESLSRKMNYWERAQICKSLTVGQL